VENYRIYSPVLGRNEQAPDIFLPEAFIEEGSANVQLRFGEVHGTRKRRTLLRESPDGNPFLKFHWFEKSDGLKYLFGFTKANAYKFDATAVTSPDTQYVEGLDDFSTQNSTLEYKQKGTLSITISNEGTPDQFNWQLNGPDGLAVAYGAGTNITGDWQDGATGTGAWDDYFGNLQIKFDATTGHTASDSWILYLNQGEWKDWNDTGDDLT